MIHYDLFFLPFICQNYIGRLNHLNTSDFVKEFEQEHQGTQSVLCFFQSFAWSRL